MAKFQTKCLTGARPLVLPATAAIAVVTVDIEFPTTAPAANDLLELLDLPAPYKVLDWKFIPPKIDSSGAPALAWSLGVENAGGTDLGAEVWATGLTIGQTNAKVSNTTSLAAQGDITTTRRIALKCTTAAATWNGSGRVGQLVLELQG